MLAIEDILERSTSRSSSPSCASKLGSPTKGCCASALEHMEGAFKASGISITYLDAPKRLKATAGTILQRCCTKVEHFRNKMVRSLCVFKVGLTSDPVQRFGFYLEANYTCMSLLHVTANMAEAQMLEAAVIAATISEPGCRNERLGGDGPSKLTPYQLYFVYVVGARADCLKAIR